MSRVDVIVPCYNYGRFLRECVQSALTQEGVEVRVLILDDASPDDTPAVAAQLVRDDPRVEYRRHEHNRGHIATYNEGLEWASGEYLLLLSADDLLTPGALARASRLMDAHPTVGLTHGRAIRTFGPEGRTTPSDGYSICQGVEWLEAICRRGSNVVETPTAVVRSAVQKKIGGYRKELPHSGDLAMWLRFAAHADVGYLNADQAYYRLHGENMSERYHGFADLLQRKAAFDTLFAEDGTRLPDCEQLRRLAYWRLAEKFFLSANEMFDGGYTAGCRQALAIALEIHPDIRYSSMWKRLRWKRLIGTRASALVRRLITQMRANTYASKSY
jgi:glycosyltransferase involved in cell wall biosynthesis